MTQDTSRKSFLSKVLGIATVGVLAPGVAAKAVLAEPEAKSGGKQPAFRLQRQDRAVARGDGST